MLRNRRLLWVAIVVILLVWPWVTGTPYMLNLAIGAAIWGLFAVSFDVVLGWTGEISFGHALFFGMGVYGAGLIALHTHWPSVLVMVATVVLVAILSLGLNYLSLRVTGPYFAMVTFAMAEFFYLIVQTATGVTGGSNGLVGMPLSPILTSPGVLYEISAVLAILAAGALWWMKRRPTGILVHAVRDNPLRAEMSGWPVNRVKLLTLSAASAMAALAGTLYLLYQGMAFTQTLDSNTSFTVLLMVIIGGSDTGWGPLMAGAALYIVETMLNATTTHWALVLGVIYVIVVRFFPQGLMGIHWLPKRISASARREQTIKGGRVGE